ncbi:hypothetical protein An09g01980 [Aspergillus niger]|uniref:Uncharacterized protein n=2 Tax=Aspergillus niger TaxID=5061 RepID=A2QTG1_ASPNC|nr:hypothetical protein An09g01980 [Aspergillus niger]CAK40136.1 hypothetical protein An09g01980 [Aspergillus niger]
MWMLDMSWVRVVSGICDCNTECIVSLYVSQCQPSKRLTNTTKHVAIRKSANLTSAGETLAGAAAELDPAETTLLPKCQQSPNTKASASG